jgi:very-short-patch-repair endonuclease
MFGIVPESFKGEKKYTKLLNNLLAIKGRDQTLFTKVNNNDSFDITTKFSASIAEKTIVQKKFNITLNEKDLDKLIDAVEKSNSAAAIIDLFEMYKERIFNTKKELLSKPNTFQETKLSLLENLREKRQKEKIRWKQFRRKVIDDNTLDNVWPLHIATFFVSIRTPNRELYGPLFLREATLNISDENVILNGTDTWKINEKLFFMLNEAGLFLDATAFNQDDDFATLCQKISKQLNLGELSISLTEPFVNRKVGDITSKVLDYHPGVVLGLFKPSGGNLRKTMQEIIDNDEVDLILDADPDKSIYKQKIENFMLHNAKEIVRIQPSNFAQDKALISALIQDTIIWGPPGTGKSQVIANIIANIFFKNKTGIVMSQKKAALDVLRKRLGGIAPFALFILNDNKMNKAEFYAPLQEFVQLIENESGRSEINSKNIITEDEIKTLRTINRTKNDNTYNPSLILLETLCDELDLLKYALKLKRNLKYPTTFSDEKSYYTEFMKLNDIAYNHFLWIKIIPRDVKDNCDAAIQIIQNSLFDPNDIAHLVSYTNESAVYDLLECAKTDTKRDKYKSDVKYLISYLSSMTLTKIKAWRDIDRQMFSDYKRFANAVRAGVRLPYKFMNDHITVIRELFPVIITTPETTFINWEKEYFDYAVLDESSQIFLEVGLPILYLAKIKILAGDPKQMQPSRWFTTRDSVDENEEEDVPENTESLLDYALFKGINQIMLNQNYRSTSASLMAFSAKEFYESKLDVLDQNKMRSEYPIEVINVPGKWEQSVNYMEAKKVIEIVLKEMNKYNSIIILTFNSNQRQLIEKDILENYPVLFSLIESEKLSIRNIENIQGDEAELVIMSVVYDSTTSISSTYVARPGGKSALNVAVSRAKSKMIVIKSLSSETVRSAKTEDFVVFKNWLTFLDLKTIDQKNYSQSETYEIEESFGEVDSRFERDVIEFIKSKIRISEKVKLIKQYEVGSYAIDIALLDENDNYLLGIEVDGYRYHDGAGFDKYLSDISRQDFLEVKGYDIYRIKEIDFKINKEKIVRELSSIIELKLARN